MNHNFTIEDIAMLAKVERDMDAGRQPFVVNHCHRLAVRQEIMDELGLEHGQTITDVIAIAICEANIRSIRAQIEMRAALAKEGNEP